MANDDDTTTLIDLNGLENLHKVLDALLPAPSTEEDDDPDITRSPPQTTLGMFPGLLKEIIKECCSRSEAVPVAVCAHVLMRFAALVGPMVYLPIGDERRWLNEFILMIGPTGLGKGASGHGPKRIFKKVEDYLQLDLDRQLQAGKSQGVNRFSLLKVHSGGLSSGEGLAAALDDGKAGCDVNPPVTDKRLLVFEPEFSNIMSLCQRVGNTLSIVLRNAFDGMPIQPLTKRDRVKVTDPFVCLFAHITDSELTRHEQADMMAANGMLNRFLILWQQPTRDVPFPDPIPEERVDHLARQLAERIITARRQQHETHYQRIRPLSWCLNLDEAARRYWARHYSELINRPDAEQVQALTRRHRLHALILGGLFALLEGGSVIQKEHLTCALAWVDYSRRSVIYCYQSQKLQQQAEENHKTARRVLYAVVLLNQKHGRCTRTDIHNFYQRKLKAAAITQALETLMNWIPPLISQTAEALPSGRSVFIYKPMGGAVAGTFNVLEKRGVHK